MGSQVLISAAWYKDILHRFPRANTINALQFGTAPHPNGRRFAVMTSVAGGKEPPDKFFEYV